jgi:glyoxylase-like metal-dependent hydrolase (beta-lactamase superfamily II)
MHARELPIANADLAAIQVSAGPLDRYVVLPFIRLIGRRRREAILAASRLGNVGRTLEPGAAVPRLPSWECIPTPGHTPGHVAYFRREDRVLVSGDALATFKINSVWGLLLARDGLSGPPWYTTWNRDAAKRSIGMLADLNPYVLASSRRADGAYVAFVRRRIRWRLRESSGKTVVANMPGGSFSTSAQHRLLPASSP